MPFAGAINRALEQVLQRYQEAVLLGEDLEDPFGGAFRVTAGLSTRFPGRVINTPISEAAIVGSGLGMALAGDRPVVEIMFGDFLTLAMDQLVNHAAKATWMYGGPQPVPLTLRTATGGGRSYGPTHSQSLETLLLGVPGLEIRAPLPFHDLTRLYCEAVGSDGPGLIVEPKALYGERPQPSPHLEARLAVNGETLIFRNGGDRRPDLLVLAYGRMAWTTVGLLDRLFEEECLVELHVPSVIRPFDVTALAAPLRRRGRLVVLEEGWETAGWGRHVSGMVYDHYFSHLERPVVCLGGTDMPIGCSPEWEDRALPSAEHILATLTEAAR